MSLGIRLCLTEEVRGVEVITSVQRRRRWSVAEKMRLVEETPSGGAARELLLERVGRGGCLHLSSRLGERMLGRKTLEVEILKEALATARAKKAAVALAVARCDSSR